MFPVENLTESVSFLPLYDLDSVLLANRQLATIASNRVKDIRVWHFDQVSLIVRANSAALWATGEELIHGEGRENASNLLDVALYNASFGHIALIVYPDGHLPLPNKLALEIKKLDLS
ncbi:hypothetical protein AAVH_31492, partial [Aphelenchoides avenae]